MNVIPVELNWQDVVWYIGTATGHCFREAQPAIDAMVKRKLMAVEMEAASLCAFAQVRQKPVLCFAHVTNQMGRADGDFEKGEADGGHDAMQSIAIAADRLPSAVLP